jgi:hypothetical protein
MKAKLEYIFDLPISCFKCPFSIGFSYPMCIPLELKSLTEDDERYGFERYRKERDEECPLHILEEDL